MAEQVHPSQEWSGVESRVSWGAILAGAVVALASYLVLTMLGAAIGLSVADGVRETDGLSTGAAIWAVAATAIALFLGGWVAAQSVVGETKAEAVMHSVIMWGVVMGMILWLVASGARAGFSAMVGYSQFANNAGDRGAVTDLNRRADQAATNAEQAANNPDTRRAMQDRAANATWWALAGTLLSIAAAVGGGYVGGGTNYRWLPHASYRSVTVVGTPARG